MGSKKKYNEAMGWQVGFLIISTGSALEACKIMDLNKNTISNWKKKYPSFRKILKTLDNYRKRITEDKTLYNIISPREIIEMYIETARKGNVTAIDRLARIFGTQKMIEATGQKITLTNQIEVNYTAEEVDKIVRQAALAINPELQHAIEGEYEETPSNGTDNIHDSDQDTS